MYEREGQREPDRQTNRHTYRQTDRDEMKDIGPRKISTRAGCRVFDMIKIKLKALLTKIWKNLKLRLKRKIEREKER